MDRESTFEGPLTGFLAERAALQATRPGGPWLSTGSQIATRLSGRLDEAIGALMPEEAHVSVIAVGGYGRRELCLGSDVDLMLLHDGQVTDEVVQAVLYPLWDAGLKVGHSVRTPEQVVVAARESLETLTSLLGARVVAGAASRWEETWRLLAGLLRRERDWVVAALKGEERGRRVAEPFRLAAANVKFGRGGLRTLQTLFWERAVHEPNVSVVASSESERAARDVLLTVRNALHATSGQPGELYVPDLRARVAEWLGVETQLVSAELYACVRSTETMVDERWPDLMDELTDPIRSAGRWLVRSLRRSPSSGGERGGMAIVAAAAIRPGGRLFEGLEELKLRTSPAPGWSVEDRDALVRLVAAPERGQRIADRLSRLGYLDRMLPELAATEGMPQSAPFHEHTVDDHQWRTVAELLAVTGSESPEPWCVELAEDLGSLDELLIASLLHDAGKGRGGDHSIIGAELMRSCGQRLGFGPTAVGQMSNVVRWHLLLPQVATRRDIDDPAVVAEVAQMIGDPQLVRMLGLLAVADSRATGHSMWSPWKASLLRTLIERILGGFAPAELRTDAMETLMATLDSTFDRSAVAQHVESMGPGYLERFDAAEIRRHLDATHPHPSAGEVVIDARHDEGSTSLVVTATDRPGLLVEVSGVLALHGVRVLDARLHVSRSGLVLDTFFVTNARRPGRVSDHTVELVRRDLRRVADGELDLETALSRRATGASRAAPAAITFGTDRSTGENIVEVRAGDRPGLLHDLAAVLFAAAHDIRLAKIETRGDRVVDVFFLRTEIVDPNRLERLLMSACLS